MTVYNTNKNFLPYNRSFFFTLGIGVRKTIGSDNGEPFVIFKSGFQSRRLGIFNKNTSALLRGVYEKFHNSRLLARKTVN